MRRWVTSLEANKETETEIGHASFKVVLWVVGEKALIYTNELLLSLSVLHFAEWTPQCPVINH